MRVKKITQCNGKFSYSNSVELIAQKHQAFLFMACGTGQENLPDSLAYKKQKFKSSSNICFQETICAPENKNNRARTFVLIMTFSSDQEQIYRGQLNSAGYLSELPCFLLCKKVVGYVRSSLF